MRRWALACTALFVFAFVTAIESPPAAAAEAADRTGARAVVLGRASEADPLIVEALARLEGELATRGFQSAGSRISPGVDRRAEVHALAREAEVLGAIGLWMDATGEAVEVWVFESVTGKTLVQAIDVRPGAAANPAAAVSVRAVELLRASLLELDAGSEGAGFDDAKPSAERGEAPLAPTASDRRAIPSTVESAPARRRAWAVDAGAGAMGGIGDGGVTAFALARVGYRGRFFGARVGAFFPLSSLSVPGAVGTAELRRIGGFGELLLTPWPARVQPVFGVGGGVQHLAVRGLAEAPYEGREARLWTPYVTASLGLTIELLPWLDAWIELAAVAALSAPRIRLYDERTNPLGRVSIAPALGLSGRF